MRQFLPRLDCNAVFRVGIHHYTSSVKVDVFLHSLDENVSRESCNIQLSSGISDQCYSGFGHHTVHIRVGSIPEFLRPNRHYCCQENKGNKRRIQRKTMSIVKNLASKIQEYCQPWYISANRYVPFPQKWTPYYQIIDTRAPRIREKNFSLELCKQ